MQTRTALAAIALLACATCAACDAGAEDDAAGPLGTVVIAEIETAGRPHDWFVVRNASDGPVVLSDYVFVDRAGDLERARAFPEDVVLAPGESFRQECNDVRTGFSLGRDEELWIYRASDERLSDGVDWDAGETSVVTVLPGFTEHVEELVVHDRQVADRGDGRDRRDQVDEQHRQAEPAGAPRRLQ